jgi:murein L,D-transpeptidase YcbB/YkuD
VEVSVSNRLPIHTSYQTAWVDNLEKIHIINVVYHCDIKLAEILFASTESKVGINSNISDNE